MGVCILDNLITLPHGNFRYKNKITQKQQLTIVITYSLSFLDWDSLRKVIYSHKYITND